MELQDAHVSGLVEVGDCKWDEAIIRDLCNDRDRELILLIPLPMNNREDGWYLLLDTKGKFSVCSSYRQLQGEHPKPHARFWKKMWNLQLPGKILSLLWLACNACLPTTVALAKKRVSVDKICPWCHQEDETDIHVLFECNFARSMWLCFGL